MQYLMTFEDLYNYQKLNEIDTFTVYRGTDSNEPYNNNMIFFSISKDFADDYGKYVYKAEIKPTKIFDSFKKEHWDLLFQWNGKNGIFDPYSDQTFYSYDELVDGNPAFGSDTWEIIEYYIDDIESEGYDCVLITEGGEVNFIIFDDVLIVDSVLLENDINETNKVVNYLQKKIDRNN